FGEEALRPGAGGVPDGAEAGAGQRDGPLQPRLFPGDPRARHGNRAVQGRHRARPGISGRAPEPRDDVRRSGSARRSEGRVQGGHRAGSARSSRPPRAREGAVEGPELARGGSDVRRAQGRTRIRAAAGAELSTVAEGAPDSVRPSERIPHVCNARIANLQSGASVRGCNSHLISTESSVAWMLLYSWGKRSPPGEWCPPPPRHRALQFSQPPDIGSGGFFFATRRLNCIVAGDRPRRMKLATLSVHAGAPEGPNAPITTPIVQS